MKRSFILIFLLTTIILGACSAQPQPVTGTLSPAVNLTPYFTATLIPSATATPLNAPTATPLPTATPTPKVYIVKDTDTMVVIAYRNGITVDELKAANPTVNPYAMSVGTKLIIPPPSGAVPATAVPMSTAYPVQVEEPKCWPSATGGLYCFALVENPGEGMIQNISAVFTLTDTSTGQGKDQNALFPLSDLLNGEKIPFFTYFDPPAPANYTITLQVLTALQAAPTDPGILIHTPVLTLSVDGMTAVVTGEGVLTESAENAKQVVFTYVAVDDSQQVVGIRRVESTIDLSKGSSIPYNATIYSVAGKINQVFVYAETLP